ncbi:hypothetical protein COO60DRAFT_1229206 [Scenedesmus sp. NREL 46B-D3]|nr:hypothetical protein COO60DRAFT_1229206 [Scenedesmus sp. NREL 46B-D3]
MQRLLLPLLLRQPSLPRHASPDPQALQAVFGAVLAFVGACAAMSFLPAIKGWLLGYHQDEGDFAHTADDKAAAAAAAEEAEAAAPAAEDDPHAGLLTDRRMCRVAGASTWWLMVLVPARHPCAPCWTTSVGCGHGCHHPDTNEQAPATARSSGCRRAHPQGRQEWRCSSSWQASHHTLCIRGSSSSSRR